MSADSLMSAGSPSLIRRASLSSLGLWAWPLDVAGDSGALRRELLSWLGGELLLLLDLMDELLEEGVEAVERDLRDESSSSEDFFLGNCFLHRLVREGLLGR